MFSLKLKHIIFLELKKLKQQVDMPQKSNGTDSNKNIFTYYFLFIINRTLLFNLTTFSYSLLFIGKFNE